MPPYLETDRSYPVSEVLARYGVSLPAHGLLTEEHIAGIAGKIRQLCALRQVHAVGRQ
jgi:dTDP-4-amino-4,6-dideoxygalactose transaminase